MARTIITKTRSEAADAKVQAAHDSVFGDYQFGLNKKPAQKLTPWFDENMPPVRIGVYQVKPFTDEAELRYAYWNGQLWSYWYSHIEHLIRNHMLDILQGRTHDTLTWRGILNAKASKLERKALTSFSNNLASTIDKRVFNHLNGSLT